MCISREEEKQDIEHRWNYHRVAQECWGVAMTQGL